MRWVTVTWSTYDGMFSREVPVTIDTHAIESWHPLVGAVGQAIDPERTVVYMRSGKRYDILVPAFVVASWVGGAA